MVLGRREREVYLPAGNWKSAATGQVFAGNRRITVPAPLDTIPVFERLGDCCKNEN
jgi:alpha-D-xyloside xylohydrolase